MIPEEDLGMTFDLDHFLPYQLSLAATQVSRRFEARYGELTGLTVAEWRVMAHLAGSGVVSVRDIHTRVNLHKSVVSRAASRLQGEGLVRKSEHGNDRRLVELELTARGKSLMDRLSVVAHEFQAELMAELGSDAPAFLSALNRLRREPE